MKFLALLIILGVVAYVESTISPYCVPQLCLTGTLHVACSLDIFKLPCPPFLTEYVDLSPHISLIERVHNTLRNQVASGKMGYEPAARMATMTWSSELAEVARYNAKSCRAKRDQCRNTNNFRNSGQNQAQFGPFCESDYNSSQLVEEALKQFYDSRDKPSFKLMVKENNIKVGCSAVQFKSLFDRDWDCFESMNFYLVCNYATDTDKTELEYIAVDRNRTAQFCVTGTNPVYPSLCSTSERYLL